jgi:hypothetical protein
MDVNGAKALKRRLALNGADGTRPLTDAPDVPEDAPPVYRWTGVRQRPAESPQAGAEEEIAPRSASLFSRLSLGLR